MSCLNAQGHRWANFLEALYVFERNKIFFYNNVTEVVISTDCSIIYRTSFEQMWKALHKNKNFRFETLYLVSRISTTLRIYRTLATQIVLTLKQRIRKQNISLVYFGSERITSRRKHFNLFKFCCKVTKKKSLADLLRVGWDFCHRLHTKDGKFALCLIAILHENSQHRSKLLHFNSLSIDRTVKK